jgi:prophage regulatory protein
MQNCLQRENSVESTVRAAIGISVVKPINVGKEPIVILRLPELLRRIGLSRSTVYAMLKPGNIYFDPALSNCRIQLTSKSVGFVESMVNAWLESKAAPHH